MSVSWITFGSDAYVVSEVTPDHPLIMVPGSALGWPWLYVFFFVLFVVPGIDCRTIVDHAAPRPAPVGHTNQRLFSRYL